MESTKLARAQSSSLILLLGPQEAPEAGPPNWGPRAAHFLPGLW